MSNVTTSTHHDGFVTWHNIPEDESTVETAAASLLRLNDNGSSYSNLTEMDEIKFENMSNKKTPKPCSHFEGRPSSLTEHDWDESFATSDDDPTPSTNNQMQDHHDSSRKQMKLPLAARRTRHHHRFGMAVVATAAIATTSAASSPKVSSRRTFASHLSSTLGGAKKRIVVSETGSLALPLRREVTPIPEDNLVVAPQRRSVSLSDIGSEVDTDSDVDLDETRQSPLIDDSDNIATTSSDIMTAVNPNAVYFGWIRNSATKAWRETVKIYSQNRREYASWSDDIGRKVQDALREKMGIDTFFTCRRGKENTQEASRDGSSTRGAPETKKIFGQNNRYLGTWSIATPQEILDRTKQRFVDDRRPTATLSGAKRPRGRLSKQILRERSAFELLVTLNQFLSSGEGSRVAHCAGEKLNADHVADSEFVHHKAAPKTSDELLTLVERIQKWKPTDSELSESLVEHVTMLSCIKECKPLHKPSKDVGNVLEKCSSSTGFVNGIEKTIEVADGRLPGEYEQRSTAGYCSVTVERKPWFPVMPQNVCFGWNSHAGTVLWRETVKAFSDDATLYPEWNDAIADGVKEVSFLSRVGCSVFLVFLDEKGKNSESIHDGLWYLATDNEIVEKTKQQFNTDRASRLP